MKNFALIEICKDSWGEDVQVTDKLKIDKEFYDTIVQGAAVQIDGCKIRGSVIGVSDSEIHLVDCRNKMLKSRVQNEEKSKKGRNYKQSYLNILKNYKCLLAKYGRLRKSVRKLSVCDIGNISIRRLNIKKSTRKKSNISRKSLNIKKTTPKDSVNTSKKCPPSNEKGIIIEEDNIVFGPNKTRIPYEVYRSIVWSKPSTATRTVLSAVFTKDVLATHTLSGRPSPAFPDKKNRKPQLDTLIVADIVSLITRKCEVNESQVKQFITNKCGDEGKLEKQRIKKLEKTEKN